MLGLLLVSWQIKLLFYLDLIVKEHGEKNKHF